jgi:hypothetical protein
MKKRRPSKERRLAVRKMRKNVVKLLKKRSIKKSMATREKSKELIISKTKDKTLTQNTQKKWKRLRKNFI